DPTTGTGWVDSNPSDRRMLLASGPLTLAPGQSQDVDYAIVIGQGSNRLSSILALGRDDDEVQAFHDRAFALPLPTDQACGQVVTCPQPPAYWYDQCAGVRSDFTLEQLTEIARRVDARSSYLDWAADPLVYLCSTLNPIKASPEEQAVREYVTFLCNVAVSDP